MLQFIKLAPCILLSNAISANFFTSPDFSQWIPEAESGCIVCHQPNGSVLKLVTTDISAELSSETPNTAIITAYCMTSHATYRPGFTFSLDTFLSNSQTVFWWGAHLFPIKKKTS